MGAAGWGWWRQRRPPLRVGPKEGAEPNAGHAAAPTALRGLKITLFTRFQSWVSAALSGGLETSLCPRPHRTPSTGLEGTRALGFVSLGGCRWRDVRKAAHAVIPGGDCSLLADSSSSRRSEMQNGRAEATAEVARSCATRGPASSSQSLGGHCALGKPGSGRGSSLCM